MTSLPEKVITLSNKLFTNQNDKHEVDELLNHIVRVKGELDFEKLALHLLKLCNRNISKLKLYLSYLEMELTLTQRLFSAKLATDLYGNKITYNEFVTFYPEASQDAQIEELFSLIEHEPGEGGIFGISKTQKEDYMNKIFLLISDLEKEKKLRLKLD